MVENERSLLDCVGKDYLDQKPKKYFAGSKNQVDDIVKPRKALKPDYLPQISA